MRRAILGAILALTVAIPTGTFAAGAGGVGAGGVGAGTAGAGTAGAAQSAAPRHGSCSALPIPGRVPPRNRHTPADARAVVRM